MERFGQSLFFYFERAQCLHGVCYCCVVSLSPNQEISIILGVPHSRELFKAFLARPTEIVGLQLASEYLKQSNKKMDY